MTRPQRRRQDREIRSTDRAISSRRELPMTAPSPDDRTQARRESDERLASEAPLAPRAAQTGEVTMPLEAALRSLASHLDGEDADRPRSEEDRP